MDKYSAGLSMASRTESGDGGKTGLQGDPGLGGIPKDVGFRGKAPSSLAFAEQGASRPSSPRRTDGWVMPTPSPGPGVYNPSIAPIVSASERAVFGTAYREQEEKRFLSQLHNLGMPMADTPGPGSYRTANMRMLRNEQSAKFGTAPQRPDVPKESLCKPGAVYDLPSTLSSITTGFGTSTNQARANRSTRPNSPLRDYRSMQSERFPLDHIEGPGPDAYPLIPADKLSQHGATPRFTFGRASREAATRGHLTQEHMQADPTVSTACATPAAVYDIRGLGELRPSAVAVFPRGPAHFNPERGGNAKGPYISRLHEDANKGIDSPGPGAYAASSSLHSAGGAKFGPASPTRTPKPNEVEVPGPGAHNPNFGALSVRPSASAFSMGANLRTDWAAFSPVTPGPAAYGLPPAEKISINSTAPSYSMGTMPHSGRMSHVAHSATPAPDAYGRPEDPRDQNPVRAKRGYTFGMRERAKTAGSVVSNRYHGPLHAAEAMCIDSPGPGCYDVPSLVPAPGVRFGTSGRDAGAKIYISHMHATAEGFGTASPGPGCYNTADACGLAGPGRFAPKVAPKFGTSTRFNDKVCTK